MSRRAIEVLDDRECTIGWDEGLQTFFFQSGRLADDGETPAIWLGFTPRSLPTTDALERALHAFYHLDTCALPPPLAEALEADRLARGQSAQHPQDAHYVLSATYTEQTEDLVPPQHHHSR